MVIEQYKTGFVHPSDVPFEDLSVIGTSIAPSTGAVKMDIVRGTLTGRTKKRTGFRALFNTTKVIGLHLSLLF